MSIAQKKSNGRIIVSDKGEIRFITIEQEQRRNALTEAMIESMCEAVTDFESSPNLKVLVVSGSGDKAFCAGADLKEMAEKQTMGVKFTPVMPTLFDKILGLTKPTIAALNGDAVGGGLEIALCCSMRVARTGIRVGLPEISLGMVPRYGTALAVLLSSPATALELALFGELMLVETALNNHLVDRVISTDDFERSVRELAEKLASFSTPAVAGVLHVTRSARSVPIHELVNSPQAIATFGSPHRAEAVRDFNRNDSSGSHQNTTGIRVGSL